jgi:hypothetical protein
MGRCVSHGFYSRRNGLNVPKRKGFSASPAQRVKVADAYCAVCGGQPCDPAHLISRGATTIGQDDPLAVIPLCRTHHDEYDHARTLDLTPYLEPRYRAEVAYAVERVGLFATLRTVSNLRWLAMKDV